MFYLYVRLCTTGVPGACGNEKPLDPLEAELQMSMSGHMSPGN